jgi:hypothetical protein
MAWAAIGGATLLNLVPVIWFRFLPSSDGPAHVYNAALARDLLLGRSWTDAARPLIAFNDFPVPNWFGHLLLAIGGLALGPIEAERLLIALWIVLFPLSLLYAIRAVTPDADALALVACPLAFSAQLHWGFYNFLLSTCFFLLALGWWLRHADRAAPATTIAFAGLSLVTFACSLAGFAQLALWIGVLSICRLASGQRGAARTAAWSAIGLAPALGLSAWFWIAQPPARSDFPTWRYAAGNIGRLEVLRAFGTPFEAITASALAVVLWGTVLAGLALSWRDRRYRGWPFLVVLAASAAHVFIAPASVVGASLLTPRQVYFVVLAAALWMAAHGARRPGAVLACACALAAVALVAARWPVYEKYDAAMRRFVDAIAQADFGRARTLLSVPSRRQPRVGPSGRPAVVLSGAAAGYVAALRQLVWLDDYELRTTHFPLRTRHEPWTDGSLQFVTAPDTRIDALLTWDGDARTRAALADRLMSPPAGTLSRIEFPSVPDAPTLFVRRTVPPHAN